MTGFNEFARNRTLKNGFGCFSVLNIASDRKTIKIFGYPIPFLKERDLLRIPGVGEADLRASLLKGEIKNKILAHEIIVVCSDIDLLQFNEQQKQFLMNAGIDNGLSVSGGGGGGSAFVRVFEKIETGQMANTIHTLPGGNTYAPDKMIVYLRGRLRTPGLKSDGYDYQEVSPTQIRFYFALEPGDIINYFIYQ